MDNKNKYKVMENLTETKNLNELNERIVRYQKQGEENFNLHKDTTNHIIRDVPLNILKKLAEEQNEKISDAQTMPKKLLFLSFEHGSIMIYSEDVASIAVTVHELIEC